MPLVYALLVLMGIGFAVRVYSDGFSMVGFFDTLLATLASGRFWAFLVIFCFVVVVRARRLRRG